MAAYNQLYAWRRIGIIALDEESAAGLDVTGVVIARVMPGSSADRAGLIGIDFRNRRLGDIIIAVNGREVRELGEFVSILQEFEIGRVVALQVQRDREIRTVEVEIIDIA